MSSVVETLLLFIMRKFLSPELIKTGEVALIAFLRKMAADTSNRVDDAMVDLIAEALGVA